MIDLHDRDTGTLIATISEEELALLVRELDRADPAARLPLRGTAQAPTKPEYNPFGFVPTPQATEPQIRAIYEGFGLNSRQIEIVGAVRLENGRVVDEDAKRPQRIPRAGDERAGDGGLPEVDSAGLW